MTPYGSARLGASKKHFTVLPSIQEGYYTVQTLRQAIQDALSNDRHLFAEYKVEYDQRLARYLFSNPFTISGESFLPYTQESLKIEAHQDTPPLSAVILGLSVRLDWWMAQLYCAISTLAQFQHLMSQTFKQTPSCL